MAVSPAICEALHRRSPAIIWYLSSATCLNVVGCIMPISRMLLASSCNAVWSSSLRGWLGFASIWLSGISFIVELPCGRTSSVDIKASSPRPSAFPYLFFTAVLHVWFYGFCGLVVIRHAVLQFGFRLMTASIYGLFAAPTLIFVYYFFGQCQVVFASGRVCVVQNHRQPMAWRFA